jgi:N-methylhydantoinase A
MKFRLGCDIGGTFTDFVLFDQKTSHFEIGKVLTTPRDPSEAIDQGIDDLLQLMPDFLQHTDHIIHGTTLVVNAFIERRGAKTALITTKGFRDILEMRREMRYDIHDISAVPAKPIVPRHLRCEVSERIYSDGSIITPLNEPEARQVIESLAVEGVETLAIVFLHSYANPEHERIVGRIASEDHPEIAVSLSSDVLPEIREFERTSTTVLNAYVKPLVDRYLARLTERLMARSYSRSVLLMLSSGGTTSTQIGRRYPVRLVESGPVGGAIAARHVAERAGLRNVISFDMGGTTAKACCIRDGRLPLTTEFEIDRAHRFKKGSGTPLAVPAVDLLEIGAGGGSIASINDLGVIQVGPQSSGSVPGPICYGRGGTEPTTTDADLVLGYLNPDYFLGGEMRLDLDGARKGIQESIARPLGLTVEQAAWGVHEIVNENMASAARIHIAEQAGELANATFIPFGGAGPVHAHGVARKLGVSQMLVPRGAGVFSALGFVLAPVSFEVSRTIMKPIINWSAESFHQQLRNLEAEANGAVQSASPGSAVDHAHTVDVCYRGQGYGVRLSLSDRMGTPISFDQIVSKFAEEYRNRFGYSCDDMDVVVQTLRTTATARRDKHEISLPFTGRPGDASGAIKGERPAYSWSEERFVSHKVYAAELLGDGAGIEGPAIVEEEASTLVVGTGAAAAVDGRGWVLITLLGAT